MSEIPTRDRIMALLSPPSQDVWLTVDDARWVKAEIDRLQDEVDRMQHALWAYLRPGEPMPVRRDDPGNRSNYLNNRSDDRRHDDLVALIVRQHRVFEYLMTLDLPPVARKTCEEMLDPERAAGPAGSKDAVRILERLGGRKD